VIYQKLREFQEPALFLPLPLLIVGLCGYQLYQLNFVHYDDDQLPYVYAHTKRPMLAMLDQIERIGQKNGTGEDTGIAIVSPDYWPLPWYFRNYKKIGYYSQIVPTNEPIIIGSEAQEEQLKATYADRYDMLKSDSEDGAYPLRPGVDLVLYVRRDVKR
jgi:predicted membrane-bound mannosyltransferase